MNGEFPDPKNEIDRARACIDQHPNSIVNRYFVVYQQIKMRKSFKKSISSVLILLSSIDFVKKQFKSSSSDI